MAAKLRVEDFQAYRPFHEIEALQPIQRVNPQRPRDEYPQEDGNAQGGRDDISRRRFAAIRSLIEGLKLAGKIERVDYATVVQELSQLGILQLEIDLFPCLQGLQMPRDGMLHLLEQLQQASSPPEFGFGPIMDEENNIFPLYIRGLSKFYMQFQKLLLPPGLEGSLLVEAISNEGFYRYSSGRLRMECRPQVKAQFDSDLEIHVRVHVAVGEVDEDNRRAILYQRSDGEYALYTDKQISFTI